MEQKLPFAAAFLATAFALSPTKLAANENGEAHGWDVPSLAEFVMEDVQTKLLLPPPARYVSRDIHVDCDLLVRPGDALEKGKTYPTVGFAIQFNAESQYTVDAFNEIDRRSGVPEGTTVGRLQGWVGQMDYSGSSFSGVMGHLTSQHDIPVSVIAEAIQECQTNFPTHGVKESELSGSVTPRSKIHEDWVDHRFGLGLNSP